MSGLMVDLQNATVKQHCKILRMPMIGSQFSTLAEQAVRENRTHVGYLEALLTAEIEEREKNTIERRLKEARLPRVKTLDEFDFDQSPLVKAAKMRELADGGYIEKAEPVLLIGDCGTGKTHPAREPADGAGDQVSAAGVHGRNRPLSRGGGGRTGESGQALVHYDAGEPGA